MNKELKIRRIIEEVVDSAKSARMRLETAEYLFADRVKNGTLSVEESVKKTLEARMEAVETENHAVMYATWRINALMNDVLTSHIPIEGHIGYWHVIDINRINGETLLLLEHDRFGDMTENLIVKEGTHEVVLDDVYNGWEDYFDQFEETSKWTNPEGCAEEREKMLG